MYAAIATDNTDSQYGKMNIEEWQQYVTSYYSQYFPGNHFTIFSSELYEAIKNAIQMSNPQRIMQTLDESIASYLARAIGETEQSLPEIEMEMVTDIAGSKQQQENSGILSKLCASNHNKRLIILRGTAGSGKSILARNVFAIQLRAYQHFSKTDSHTPYLFKKKYLSCDKEYPISPSSWYFPIFIDYVTQPQSLQQHLINQGFNDEIAELILKEENLFIIIDGIEEMKQQVNIEDFLSSIGKIQSARFLITYRSPLDNENDTRFNHLTKQFETYFAKRTSYFFVDAAQKNHTELLTLANLSRSQVELYLAAALPYSEDPVLEMIEQQYRVLAGFLTNPLTLFLISKTYRLLLEKLSSDKSSTSKALLYELYLKELIANALTENGFDSENSWVEQLFLDYCENVALAIADHNKLNPRRFLYLDSLTKLLMRSCPIIVTDQSVRFIHISFLHYLIASIVAKDLINNDELLFKQQDKNDNVPVLDFLFEMLLAYAKKLQDRVEFNRIYEYLTTCAIKRRSGADILVTLFDKKNHGCPVSSEVKLSHAIMLTESGQTKKAKALYLEVVDDPIYTSNNRKLYNLFCNLGTACQSNKDYDDAKFYFHKALEMSHTLQPKDNAIGYLYNALSSFYYDPDENNPHHNVEESIRFLMLSIQEERYIDTVKTWRYIGWGYFNLARIYANHPEYLNATKARQYFTKFHECISKQFQEKSQWPESYRKVDDDFELKVSTLETLQHAGARDKDSLSVTR